MSLCGITKETFSSGKPPWPVLIRPHLSKYKGYT